MERDTYSAFSVLGFERVFGIGNIKATPCPLVCIPIFVLLSRIDKGLHPLRVRGLVFLQVHNVEPIRESLLYVAHREVEPLSVIQCVEIEI